MAELKLQSPLQYVKGVGPKKAEFLHSIGITSIKDILFYFPRSYLDRTSVTDIAKIFKKSSSCIGKRIRKYGITYHYNGKRGFERNCIICDKKIKESVKKNRIITLKCFRSFVIK